MCIINLKTVLTLYKYCIYKIIHCICTLAIKCLVPNHTVQEFQPI